VCLNTGEVRLIEPPGFRSNNGPTTSHCFSSNESKRLNDICREGRNISKVIVLLHFFMRNFSMPEL
jgi:hypothetical protein